MKLEFQNYSTISKYAFENRYNDFQNTKYQIPNTKIRITNQKNMKTVVLYETAPDTTMEKMMEVFPAHQANEEIFVKAGRILGIGPFAIPGEGAMAIFTDRESAEEFVKGDPFVTTGLVSKVIIKEWHDELM